MEKLTPKQRLQRRDNLGSTIAAMGPLIGFLIFGVIPLILATIVSFTELHTTDLKDMEFVGTENYETILTNGDKATYASYWSTIVYSLNVPICIALALYIANLLNKAKFGQRFFRSVFFIPYVCAAVVVALSFKIIYHRESGVLNAILSFLGFAPISWLNDSPWTFMASTIIMTVWQGLGFCILLFQAALANVDKKLYEAAKLDGASDAQIFWKITWPAISPTTSYLITMKIIWALQAMTETYILTNGPNTVVPTWGEMGNGAWVSDLVVKHIYNMVWLRPAQAGYGIAAAAGWILAIIVFIVTKINMKLQERWVSYDF